MNMVYSDEYWMKFALDNASNAYQIGEIPVGAIIVVENKIIGNGFNQPISTNDTTSHAEINAIRTANKYIKNYRIPNATMYVTLEPCTMCFGAMVHSRIKRLVYGTKEPKSGVIESNLNLNENSIYNHKLSITGGVLADECSQLLKDFFKSKRKS